MLADTAKDDRVGVIKEPIAAGTGSIGQMQRACIGADKSVQRRQSGRQLAKVRAAKPLAALTFANWPPEWPPVGEGQGC